MRPCDAQCRAAGAALAALREALPLLSSQKIIERGRDTAADDEARLVRERTESLVPLQRCKAVFLNPLYNPKPIKIQLYIP